MFELWKKEYTWRATYEEKLRCTRSGCVVLHCLIWKYPWNYCATILLYGRFHEQNVVSCLRFSTFQNRLTKEPLYRECIVISALCATVLFRESHNSGSGGWWWKLRGRGVNHLKMATLEQFNYGFKWVTSTTAVCFRSLLSHPRTVVLLLFVSPFAASGKLRDRSVFDHWLPEFGGNQPWYCYSPIRFGGG